METWPSPPTTTCPPLRTDNMVVPLNGFKFVTFRVMIGIGIVTEWSELKKLELATGIDA
jgi:hypothetical protein